MPGGITRAADSLQIPKATATTLIQKLDPVHSTLGGTLVALIPIVLLLVLLAVLRMSAGHDDVRGGRGDQRQ